MKTKMMKLALLAATGFGVWAIPTTASAQYVVDPGQYALADAQSQFNQAQANYDSACAAVQHAQADFDAARQRVDSIAGALSQEQQNQASLQSQLTQAQANLPQLQSNLRTAQDRLAGLQSALPELQRQLDAALANYQNACAGAMGQLQQRSDFQAAQFNVQSAQRDLDQATHDTIASLSLSPQYRVAYNQWQAADQYYQNVRATNPGDTQRVEAAANSAAGAKARLDALVNSALTQNSRVSILRQRLDFAQAQVTRVQNDFQRQLDVQPAIAPLASQRNDAQRNLDQARAAFQADQSEIDRLQSGRDQTVAALQNLSNALTVSSNRIAQLGTDLNNGQREIADRQAGLQQLESSADAARAVRDQDAQILNDRQAAVAPVQQQFAPPPVIYQDPTPQPVYPVYPVRVIPPPDPDWSIRFDLNDLLHHRDSDRHDVERHDPNPRDDGRHDVGPHDDGRHDQRDVRPLPPRNVPPPQHIAPPPRARSHR